MQSKNLRALIIVGVHSELAQSLLHRHVNISKTYRLVIGIGRRQNDNSTHLSTRYRYMAGDARHISILHRAMKVIPSSYHIDIVNCAIDKTNKAAMKKSLNGVNATLVSFCQQHPTVRLTYIGSTAILSTPLLRTGYAKVKSYGLNMIATANISYNVVMLPQIMTAGSQAHHNANYCDKYTISRYFAARCILEALMYHGDRSLFLPSADDLSFYPRRHRTTLTTLISLCSAILRWLFLSYNRHFDERTITYDILALAPRSWSTSINHHLLPHNHIKKLTAKYELSPYIVRSTS